MPSNVIGNRIGNYNMGNGAENGSDSPLNAEKIKQGNLNDAFFCPEMGWLAEEMKNCPSDRTNRNEIKDHRLLSLGSDSVFVLRLSKKIAENNNQQSKQDAKLRERNSFSRYFSQLITTS